MLGSFDRYSNGSYRTCHPTWHEEDAPGKCRDVYPFLRRVEADDPVLSIVDVGAGTGGVLAHLGLTLRAHGADIPRLVGYEPSLVPLSASASAVGVEMRREFFTSDGERYDVALLIDVLEHLDNPRQLLVAILGRARHLVVRQPLLESFGAFRHNTYRLQRDSLGHVAYWNVRSFADLMHSAGWLPLATQLVAPWELAGSRARGGLLRTSFVRISRSYSSFLMSGFYTLGLYESVDSEGASG